MPLLAFFALSFFTLAVALFAFRRRPPKLLVLALPLLIVTAALQPGGKSLAFLLLFVDWFAMRTLLRPLAFRAALPGGPGRFWAVVMAILFECSLLSLARPLCEHIFDLILAAAVIAPFSWVCGDYALRYLLLPGLWRRGEEKEALVWVKGDRLVVEGLLYRIPQWLWSRGLAENKLRARLTLCSAPLGAGVVKNLVPLGAGWQLDAGGPLQAEFNDEVPLKPDFIQRDAPGAEGQEASLGSQMPQSQRVYAGLRPALFVLGLMVLVLGCEAVIFAWVLYYKALVTLGQAVLIGLLLTVVCAAGAFLPFVVVLRLAKRKRNEKSAS